ncbi:4'-phosphopantetheinyl transferase family protein [Arthrobacter globiformis]|uniref:4'-phosphopantetheinyl transferase family protein n=1 Tax=Arthrobacter globiformis TaxID=1665 RepID=UPI0027D80FE8|nr:4'-phosphopantetheinyl transferase superfamily protein [Arthrobacter globiformis]
MTYQQCSNPSGDGVERPAEPDPKRILLAAVMLSSIDLRQADTLDDGERQRAASFRSELQRDRFLAGRIALRRQAARAAGVGAGALQADYYCRECTRSDHVHGTPRYQAGPSRPTVLASLSRAGDWCLLAATTDEQVLGVGVDLEGSTAAGFEGFGAVALSEREREHLQRVEPALRPSVQTHLWTRKEAVLKALGRGLAVVDPGLLDVAGPVPLLPDLLQTAPAGPFVTGVPLVEGQEGGRHRWLVDAVEPDSVGLPGSLTAAVAVVLKL